MEAIKSLKKDFIKANSKRYKKEEPKKEEKEDKAEKDTPMLMIRIQKLRGK